MRRISLYAVICASLIFFINASVWEGAAAAAGSGELPENGLYIATNSFPVNTVVDVTNLENGKTVRVIASSSLDAPGLLAILSKEAANVIGLPQRSLGRIRMSQGEDPAFFSRFGDELSSSGDPDYDPSVYVAMNGYGVVPGEGETIDGPGSSRIEGGELIVDLPDSAERTFDEYAESEYTVPELAEEEPMMELPMESELIAEEEEWDEEPPMEEPDYDLALVPAETRPPEESFDIDESLIIPGIGDEPPLAEAPPLLPPEQPWEPEVYTPLSSSTFSAPLISSLEKGKYYLQVAAFSKAETVESELLKIDHKLPRAVMNAGTMDKPIYRILIGPVNLGESGALLQRFKLDFKDAFVRLGS